MSLKQNIEQVWEDCATDNSIHGSEKDVFIENILTLIQKERDETLKEIEEAKEWVLKNVQIGEYNLHYSDVDQVLTKIKNKLKGGE